MPPAQFLLRASYAIAVKLSQQSAPLEPVYDLFVVPARQQKAAIEARAAGHAGGLAKAYNNECGFLRPCP